MDHLTTVIIHFFVALIEFFVINWLGKHSVSSGYYSLTFIQGIEEAPLFNVMFRVLAPTAYLIITGAIWYAAGLDDVVRDYWHVTAFYFLIRWTYNFAVGRWKLLRLSNQLIVATLAMALSFVVSRELLVNKEIILPSTRGLTDQLWIILIGFVYLALRGIEWPTLGKSNDEKREEYVRAQYTALKRRFGEIVSKTAANRPSELVSYAVMIYESFNRPRIYQWVENFVLFPAGRARTLGPMQVTTTLRLPDEELVRLGVERVNANFDTAIAGLKKESPEIFAVGKQRIPEAPGSLNITALDVQAARFDDVHRSYQSKIVMRAASLYNVRSDYPNQVAGIFQILRDTYYSDLTGPKVTQEEGGKIAGGGNVV
jgi:hypothetical protein